VSESGLLPSSSTWRELVNAHTGQGWPVRVPRSGASSGGPRRRILAGLAGAALAVALGAAVLAPVPAQARANADALPTIALSQLPPQARETHQRILSGGPFPYAKDGSVFFNRERLLPPQPRGWYREYTVPTPGAPNRGARRIVCGGTVPTAPQACYYTADHYASFARIVQAP